MSHTWTAGSRRGGSDARRDAARSAAVAPARAGVGGEPAVDRSHKRCPRRGGRAAARAVLRAATVVDCHVRPPRDRGGPAIRRSAASTIRRAASASSSGDPASLDRTALRAFSAVVVGGLDRLTVSDRDRLDWFVRERGGSLVLLPDARPGIAPWTRMVVWRNHSRGASRASSVLAVAPPLPAIQASELLTFRGARVLGARVLGAAVPGAAVPGAAVPGARCRVPRCWCAVQVHGVERCRSSMRDAIYGAWGWPAARVGRSRRVAIQGRQGLGIRSVLAIGDRRRGARDAAGRGRGDRAGSRPTRRISSRRGARPSLRLRCWRHGPASGFGTAGFGRAGSVVAGSGSRRLQRIVRRRLARCCSGSPSRLARTGPRARRDRP